MATTDLALQSSGTFCRPGAIGRTVRLLFGVLCLCYVYQLIVAVPDALSENGRVRAIVWNGVLPGFFLISYVVNIGFSRSWEKWPAIVSCLVFCTIGILGYLTTDSFETPTLAAVILSWECYLFGHLGLAFVMSCILATPGCEMRAFHDLYSRITGTPTKEHHCPVGPLSAIDAWERKHT